MFFEVSEIPKSVEIQRHLTSIHIDNWIKYDVFTSKWWLLLGLILILIIIWWVLLDKSRLPEILLYVVLATIMALGIVEYGEELTLWDYPIDIIPVFPPLTSINLLSLPLIYSLIYQYFTTKKSFAWATIIATTIICFILEPMLVWVNLYQLVHWEYYYSLPIDVILALFARIVLMKILDITRKYKNVK